VEARAPAWVRAGLAWQHLALVAHHCYGSYDLALKAIVTLIEMGAVPDGSNKRYLASLRKPH